MGGLTPLGVIHTLFSLVAIVSGIVSLMQSKEISAKSRAGQTYLVTTLITANRVVPLVVIMPLLI